MSKIGKKPIIVPEDVEVKIKEDIVKIKGPLGEEEFIIPQDFYVELDENRLLKIAPKNTKNKEIKKLWGTYRSLLNNKIIGVKEGFVTTLILEGLGYSAELVNNEIHFKLGFSHPVKIKIPEGLSVNIQQAKGQYLISIKGLNKEKVGLFAAEIRKIKPRDAYKLKGFRFADENVKPKPIKKALGR